MILTRNKSLFLKQRWDDAFRGGFKAATKGLELEENPHRAGTYIHQSWENGHRKFHRLKHEPTQL